MSLNQKIFTGHRIMLSSCCVNLIIRVISFNCSSQQSRPQAPGFCRHRKWEGLLGCSMGSDYFSVLWQSSDKHIFVTSGDWYWYVWFLLNEVFSMVKTQPWPHRLANPQFSLFSRYRALPAGHRPTSVSAVALPPRATRWHPLWEGACSADTCSGLHPGYLTLEDRRA